MDAIDFFFKFKIANHIYRNIDDLLPCMNITEIVIMDQLERLHLVDMIIGIGKFNCILFNACPKTQH